MDCFFKDWFKKRAEEKQRKAQQEIKQQKLKENSDKKFDAYKMFTMANSSRINSTESKIEKGDGKYICKTTTFTEFGPIIKNSVYSEKVINGVNYTDEYVTFEGYIKPTEDENALSGYIYLEHRVFYLSNPVERETYTFNCYTGFCRDSLGGVTEINCRFRSDEKSDKYKDVIKTFEDRIEKVEDKIKKREDVGRQ